MPSHTTKLHLKKNIAFQNILPLACFHGYRKDTFASYVRHSTPVKSGDPSTMHKMNFQKWPNQTCQVAQDD